jgi:hypothetical protein
VLRRVTAGIVVATALVACGSSAPTPTGSRTVGAGIEHNLQVGWNGYKFQSVKVMEAQLAAAIQKDPTLTQVGAIEAGYVFAQRLDLQRRLLPGDETRLVDFMEQTFPEAAPILRRDLG